MLNDICPIQFIEGINECAKIADDYINTKEYHGVAIDYCPKLTYSLNKFDIFLVHQQMPTGDKYKVALCSNYDDKPSDILLSQGEWACGQERLNVWQEVELEKPVVVIRGNKYWLTIELGTGNIGLPIAVGEDVKETTLKFQGHKLWVSNTRFKTGKVMLKFYGRVLPVIS
jgi:hypothetical protein